MSNKIEEQVVSIIIEKLENGVVPWQQPYTDATVPINWVTQKPYSGVNLWILDQGGEYLTYKQIKNLGGYVKKGEKSKIIVFWKMYKVKNEEDTADGEEDDTGKVIPLLKMYRVFEVSQCVGIERRRKDVEHSEREELTDEHLKQGIQKARGIIEGYTDKPKYIERSGAGAFYRPSEDAIYLSPKSQYRNDVVYYSTFFHELVHSTGSADRLSRAGVISIEGMGSKSYSREELVAEFGASMLSGYCGLHEEIIDNSASYINSWIRRIKEEPGIILKSTSEAGRAVDYILKHNTFVLDDTEVEDELVKEIKGEFKDKGYKNYHREKDYVKKMLYVNSLTRLLEGAEIGKLIEDYQNTNGEKLKDEGKTKYKEDVVDYLLKYIEDELYQPTIQLLVKESQLQQLTLTKGLVGKVLEKLHVSRELLKVTVTDFPKQVTKVVIGELSNQEETPVEASEVRRMERLYKQVDNYNSLEGAKPLKIAKSPSTGTPSILIQNAQNTTKLLVTYREFKVQVGGEKGKVKTLYKLYSSKQSALQAMEDVKLWEQLSKLGYTKPELKILYNLFHTSFDLRRKI